MSRESFDRILQTIDDEGTCVLYTSLYVHLADQLDWGMIEPGKPLRRHRSCLTGWIWVFRARKKKRAENGGESLMEHYVTGIIEKISRIWEELR